MQRVEEAAAGGNPQRGIRRLPVWGHQRRHRQCRTPRAGDAATPLETGARQHGDAEKQRAARQDIPGPSSGRTLRGAESEVEQMHNYISRIGFNLHKAIRNRIADLIRRYRRALHSGIARAHEAANRAADARGWDPAAVDGMLQEVEESTATLFPAAEQVLQELEEEARANWEERAIYHATQVTNLAGEAFETLSENRWSRRDCTEYQDELEWVMRTFRRVCDELDFMSMPAKMRRMAPARQERVNHEYQRATRVVERLLQAH